MKLSNTLYGLTLLPNGVSTDWQWNRHFYRPTDPHRRTDVQGSPLACLWPATTTEDKRSMAWFTWHPGDPGAMEAMEAMGGGPASHVWLPLRQTHFKHVQTIGQRTKRYPRCYLIDIHLSLKMDKEHQETLQHGCWSWTYKYTYTYTYTYTHTYTFAYTYTYAYTYIYIYIYYLYIYSE